MVCRVLLFAQGAVPDTCLHQQMSHNLLKLYKRHLGRVGGAYQKDEIDTTRKMLEVEPYHFAYTASGAVALHCVANMFANHKAAACAVAPVGSDGKPQQAMAVDTPIAPCTPEISGMAQTVGTFHNLLYLSFPNHHFATNLRMIRQKRRQGCLLLLSLTVQSKRLSACRALAMTTTHRTPLIANAQRPAPLLAAAVNHVSSCFSAHAR
jgi:hypothetical protein